LFLDIESKVNVRRSWFSPRKAISMKKPSKTNATKTSNWETSFAWLCRTRYSTRKCLLEQSLRENQLTKLCFGYATVFSTELSTWEISSMVFGNKRYAKIL